MAQLELIRGAGDMFTVRGSGFKAQERIALSITVQSQSGTIVTGTGTLIQSGGSSTQSMTVTVDADPRGSFQWSSVISSPSGASVSVMASGAQGSHAQVRTTLSHTGREGSV
jgi:hypothetical protein